MSFSESLEGQIGYIYGPSISHRSHTCNPCAQFRLYCILPKSFPTCTDHAASERRLPWKVVFEPRRFFQSRPLLCRRKVFSFLERSALPYECLKISCAAAHDKPDEDILNGVKIGVGSMVEYRIGAEKRLGILQRKEGKRNWQALDWRGLSSVIHPRQILYVVPLSGQELAHTDLAAFLQQVQEAVDPSLVTTAWEFLLDEEEGERQLRPESFAELVFSKAGPVECYAAHSMLSNDRIYFKDKAGQYEARTPAVVADLKQLVEAEAARQREFEQFVDMVRSSLQSSDPVDLDKLSSDAVERIKILEDFAVLGDAAGNTKLRAIELAHALSIPPTQAGCFNALVQLGLFNEHENLALRKSNVAVDFPLPIVDIARYAEEFMVDSVRDRRDLRHHTVYTIDDASTIEIDDGLSVEILPDSSTRVWVHIADPSRWVAVADDLDMEARSRSTTVYLPTAMIPMFPPSLATGAMSLVQGKDCCALSFCVELRDDGSIKSYELCPSTIRPSQRLTYADVDLLLDHAVDPDLQVLWDMAERRARYREKKGCVSIAIPEMSIKVSECNEIAVEVFKFTGSRRLVAEFMILCGEIAGMYGQEHGIPLPYRGQPKPELPTHDELRGVPELVQMYMLRSRMPKSGMGTTPMRHSSLGLDTYVQVTSPIRRYLDLVAHFQIKAHLAGETLPFTAEHLQQVMSLTGSSTGEAMSVQRASERYWVLEFLRRQDRSSVFRAIIVKMLRDDDRLALILLEDIALELVMRFKRPISLGEQVWVQVNAVDPRQDTITLVEAANLDIPPSHTLPSNVSVSA